MQMTLDAPAVGSGETASVIDARVVFLTHYIPLYQVRVLQEIAASVREFHVLLSTPIEPNREFRPDWSGLDVSVQKCLTVRRKWKHKSAGFDDPLFVHVPYDTGAQLKRLRPDVVMSLELGVRSAGAAKYCRRNPDAKLILCTYMSMHTEQGRGWLRHRLRDRLLDRADAVTYNGPSCRDYLAQFDVPESRLFHLPYAADDRSAYTGPVARDESVVRDRLLCIGQLSGRKGVDRLVGQLQEYCSQRPDATLHVTFAGDGPLRAELQAASLPGNLTLNFRGNVPAAELAGLMETHSAIIAPTLADEWLLVVNEGLQAGLPVIGSLYAQAVTTLVADGINGWQYDPLDDGSLSAVLDRYRSCSDAEMAEMRSRCRDAIAGRTPSDSARGAIDAIRSVTTMQNESCGARS